MISSIRGSFFRACILPISDFAPLFSSERSWFEILMPGGGAFAPIRRFPEKAMHKIWKTRFTYLVYVGKKDSSRSGMTIPVKNDRSEREINSFTIYQRLHFLFPLFLWKNGNFFNRRKIFLKIVSMVG